MGSGMFIKARGCCWLGGELLVGILDIMLYLT